MCFSSVLFLPYRGVVTAGWPSPAEEELTDTINFEEWLVPNKVASCLVRVSTEAMSEAGIRPKDVVVMERGLKPQNEDVVIAEVDGEMVMRHYEERAGKVFLLPANKKFDIIQPQEAMKLVGVVTAVIRKYR